MAIVYLVPEENLADLRWLREIPGISAVRLFYRKRFATSQAVSSAVRSVGRLGLRLMVTPLHSERTFLQTTAYVEGIVRLDSSVQKKNLPITLVAPRTDGSFAIAFSIVAQVHGFSLLTAPETQDASPAIVPIRTLLSLPALGHVKHTLLRFLTEGPRTRKEVTNMMSELELAMPTISIHLSELEELGFITRQKEDRQLVVDVRPELFDFLSQYFEVIGDAKRPKRSAVSVAPGIRRITAR